MPILRGIAKGVGGFIFVTSLATAIMAAAMANFTAYDNIKGPLTDVIVSVAGEQMQPGQAEQMLAFFQAQCANTTAPTITQTFDNTTITLNCAEVSTATAADLSRLAAGSLVQQLYYRDYGCSYLDCLRSGVIEREGPFVLIASAEANRFFSSIIVYLLIAAALGGALMAWGAGSIPAALKAFGWSLLVIGIGYFGIGLVESAIPAPAGLQAAVSALTGPLFGVMAQYFLYSLVAGIILLVAGYGYGFLAPKSKTAAKRVK